MQVIDLVELTERLGIPIKRSGRTVKAECQFHDDTNPSMVLYDEANGQRQHYHCFVCNTSADIFKLTQARKNLNFLESVDWLAQTYSLKRSHAKKSSNLATTPPSSPSAIGIAPEGQSGFDLALAMYLRSNKREVLASWFESRGFDPNSSELKEIYYAARNTLTNASTSTAVDADRKLTHLQGVC